MAGFTTLTGVAKHTDLLNKEVAGIIDHADASITTVKIADLAVTRAKLEYPTTDVSFAYLAVINAVRYCAYLTSGVAVLHKDSFADKSVFAAVQVNQYPAVLARFQGTNTFYVATYYPPAATADHWFSKYVAGTGTILATEAVDINNAGRGLQLSCSGTTISSKRYELSSIINPLSLPAANATLSATDTSIASGCFGYRPLSEASPHSGATPDCVYLKAPASPLPSPIAYFEVPVIGDGSMENQFRAQIPEEIVIDSTYGKTNRLSLTHSSLIKTDAATGKPVEYRAIVRVFDQPDRQTHLRPIVEAIQALKAIQGVRELTRGEAIREAKKLDDKLTDFDLLKFPRPPTAIIREYINTRRSIYNVETDEEMAKYILESDKGW